MKQKISKARETVEKRNQLDGMILEVEKTVKENKDKLEAADVNQLNKLLKKQNKHSKIMLKMQKNCKKQLMS